LVSELGFAAAEISVLQSQLAAARARREADNAYDLAEDLLCRDDRFATVYRRLLAATSSSSTQWAART
jgi:hypothetical protein